ncbi:hypothetical protein KKF84_09755 [Myxococcota bacterium]|nr:hypothetical protein [Myxococcota bacterium]MBU1535596.1 hypothetical protein [Myxococcota bacterium]
MSPKNSAPVVRVISACTGAKTLRCDAPLSFEEVQMIRAGSPPVRTRDLPTARARDLYAGRQHTELMRGMEKMNPAIRTELYILSAAYGLVGGDQLLYPYEATFSGKSPRVIDAMSRELDLKNALSTALSTAADCTLVLLGSGYLRAARLWELSGDFSRTIVLGAPSAANLAPRGSLYIPLALPEARKFRSTLIALKGVLGGRFLERCDLPVVIPSTPSEFLRMVAR